MGQNNDYVVNDDDSYDDVDEDYGDTKSLRRHQVSHKTATGLLIVLIMGLADHDEGDVFDDGGSVLMLDMTRSQFR